MIASSSKLLSAGSVTLLDAAEIVVGQPTCFLASGSGFSLDGFSALGSAVLTFEDLVDGGQVAMVASVSHATARRVCSIEQTSDSVKTIFVRSELAAAEGGTVDFLAIRV